MTAVLGNAALLYVPQHWCKSDSIYNPNLSKINFKVDYYSQDSSFNLQKCHVGLHQHNAHGVSVDRKERLNAQLHNVSYIIGHNEY